MIELFLLTIFFILVIFTVTYLIVPFFGAPLLPSKSKDLKDIPEAVNLSKDKKIIDIGSGTGTFITFMGKQGYSVDGIDINPFLVFLSRVRVKFHRIDSKVYYGNILNKDLSSYDVVYSYLLPDLMNKMLVKMKNEMKPGSIIISNTFSFKEIEPIKKYKKIKIYQI
jgi:SAM-dependent methyltransferase